MRKDINKSRLCNITTVRVESLDKRARRIQEARLSPLSVSTRSKSSRRASATSPRNRDSPKRVFAK